MNDRFKFRVWDKLDEEYYDENCFQMQIESSGDLFIIGVGNDGEDCFWETDNTVVEQCTGLKDKNGKLIYEGDICRIKGTYYDCDYKEYLEVDDIEKVESLEKFFGEAMLKGVYSALGCDTLQVEVIGNIHENADLLENEE